MGKHNEASLRKMLCDLQPNEPVAGSMEGARAVVEAPDTLNKSTGPGFLKMRLDSKWGCGVYGWVQKPRRSLGVWCLHLQWAFLMGFCITQGKGPCCWYPPFSCFASVHALSHLLLSHPCRWMCFPLALSSVKSWAGSQLTLKCFPGLR